MISWMVCIKPQPLSTKSIYMYCVLTALPSRVLDRLRAAVGPTASRMVSHTVTLMRGYTRYEVFWMNKTQNKTSQQQTVVSVLQANCTSSTVHCCGCWLVLPPVRTKLR